MKKILLMHGANLNILGKRDPKHYGNVTLFDIEKITKEEAKKFEYDVITYQSNCEGKLIDTLQAETPHCKGIIINPGAFTHYSYALYDALLDTQLPIVEVHLSAIHSREKWRSHSVTAPAAIQVIWGKKEIGYKDAVRVLVEYIQKC